MGYAKAVLFERMMWFPPGQRELESVVKMAWIPRDIIPELKIIAKEHKLLLDFDDLENDCGARYYDKEGNITDSDDNIKQTKESRDRFNARDYIFMYLDEMTVPQLESVLEYIRKLKGD